MANLVTSPEDLELNGGTPPWEYASPAELTVTANALNAPNGTLTAETLDIIVSGASNHKQQITVTASTQYTWSCYYKRGTATDLYVSVYDLSNLANIIASETCYSETNSSTWSRVQRTFTTPSGCTSIYIYTHRDTPSTGTYHAWRVYLNTGASPEEALISETAPRIVVPTVAVQMR